MNGLIIGRFNLPQRGHARLISYALRDCERVTVALSESESNQLKAAPWYLRVKAFDLLLNDRLKDRIDYTQWKHLDLLKGFESYTAYVGHDRHEFASCLVKSEKVAEVRLVKRFFNMSSTQWRGALDRQNVVEECSDSYRETINNIRKIERSKQGI